MKKAILLLFGMLGFMVIFPTTFLVVMDGANLLQKLLKQIYPLITSF